MKMIKLFCLLAALLWELNANAQGTSFAIVIDNTTYQNCRKSVLAYRDALERDGLKTFILSEQWANPEDVRAKLKELHQKSAKKQNLEGVVFIGDIPFASIQNAQHLTTAFKMNESAFPREDASVTSDRFYDCLYMQFEFTGRDSLNPLRYYYRLKEDSPQHLNPDFYSGRILYPSEKGGDKYAAISAYLDKVVEERGKDQTIDYLTTFAGNGYNSDCLTAWMDEGLALKELFPGVMRNDVLALTRLNFRMDPVMKHDLMDQLRRPELDIMLFNEHGSPDKQHINGSTDPSSMEERVEALKGEIYYYLRQEKRKKDGDVPGAIAYFKEEYHLTNSFFEDFLNPKADDSADPDPTAILLPDLQGLAPQPRFVMFNACYNGSFHKTGYIAGYYIFEPGRTVVCQGNTVNVLQDRWTWEMLGLLSQGVRVGQYNRLIATLEGHIIGDPAFHFAPISNYNLAQTMVTHRTDAAYWRSLLTAPYACVQSLALRMLADCNSISADELLAHFRNCSFATTRLEALKLLSRGGACPQFIAAVGEGLDDVYEPLRRNAASYSWQLCTPELLPIVVRKIVSDPQSQRVNYLLEKTLQLYPKDQAIEALKAAIANSNYPADGGRLAESLEGIKADQERKEKDIKILMDSSAPLARRIQSIRNVRNYTFHEYVPQFISLMNNANEDTGLRIATAEALGWFECSPRKAEIIKACKSLETDIPELKAEALQTILRLQ